MALHQSLAHLTVISVNPFWMVLANTVQCDIYCLIVLAFWASTQAVKRRLTWIFGVKHNLHQKGYFIKNQENVFVIRTGERVTYIWQSLNTMKQGKFMSTESLPNIWKVNKNSVILSWLVRTDWLLHTGWTLLLKKKYFSSSSQFLQS